MYILVVISLLLGRKLAEDKTGFPVSIFYYFIIYSVIAPFWMLRALFNAIRSKESSWTLERKVKAR